MSEETSMLRRFIFILLIFTGMLAPATERQKNSDYHDRRVALSKLIKGETLVFFAPLEAEGQNDLIVFLPEAIEIVLPLGLQRREKHQRFALYQLRQSHAAIVVIGILLALSGRGQQPGEDQQYKDASTQHGCLLRHRILSFGAASKGKTFAPRRH